MFRIKTISLAVASLLAANIGYITFANAADTNFDNYTPILGNPAAAGSLPESAPFTLSSPLFSQLAISNRTAATAAGQANSGSWDMMTANETGPDAGRYLFAPFETNTAGVQRIDLWDTNYNTRNTTIVAPGTQSFVSGDASRWTPWGGYLTAEESWGAGSTRGRLFEITNPTTATQNGGDFVSRNILPRVSHEGLAFDKNNTLYFIDELNGGSIYKYTSVNANATNGNDYFAAGQTSVLRVGDGNTFGATGSASWINLTDVNGVGLPGVIFANGAGLPAGTIDGRATADVAAYKGTEYNRPEDLEIQTLADGSQRLYVPTTDTHQVFSVLLANDGTTSVSLFASRNTFDAATNLAVGTAFSNPDNVAIDAEGTIYIVEDQPGGAADIWYAKDTNKDGVADSVGKWASLSTAGAEPTGLYFDKFNPNIAYVNVQHPNSGNDYLIQISAPVPEPETYAMMLAGLGVVGGMARRRKKTV